MLNLDNTFYKFFFVLVIALVYGCSHNPAKTTLKFKEKSTSVVGTSIYNNIFSTMNDTLIVWKLNNLKGSIDTTYTVDYIDSLLCFNGSGNRLVTCVLSRYVNKKETSNSDDIDFFYGEKINKQWYFFRGASIVIPRKMADGADVSKSLSYQQLHEIAIKEIYSGYLNSSGEINEEWFTKHFENVGWCDTCKTRADFEKSRLQDVSTLWLQRDTTQPIKKLVKPLNPLP